MGWAVPGKGRADALTWRCEGARCAIGAHSWKGGPTEPTSCAGRMDKACPGARCTVVARWRDEESPGARCAVEMKFERGRHSFGCVSAPVTFVVPFLLLRPVNDQFC